MATLSIVGHVDVLKLLRHDSLDLRGYLTVINQVARGNMAVLTRAKSLNQPLLICDALRSLNQLAQSQAIYS